MGAKDNASDEEKILILAKEPTAERVKALKEIIA